MKRKRRIQTSASQPDDFEAVYLSEYEITSEPIPDKRYQRLSHEVKEEFHRLHTLVKRNPRKAIAELPGWIERYPNLPILYNYLSAAYAQTGARRQAEQTILENLQRNPDYLFARLNYAEICLARQDYQGGAKVLENKFDLKWLYPRRKIFHVSEYVGFMSVVGRYYAAIGERDEAEKIYEELKKIDPHDRGTRSLRDTLHPSLRQRIARWLLKDTPARQSKNE